MGYRIGLKEKRRKLLEKELDRMIPLLIGLGAKKVILFGSLATDNVTRSSDLDLFIVMDTDMRYIRFADRVPQWIFLCIHLMR